MSLTNLLVSSTLLVASLAVSAPAWARTPRVDVCHWDTTAQMFEVLTVSTQSVDAHFRHGDSYPSTYWIDEDGDGFGDELGRTDECPTPGYVADHTDCDDGDPDVYPFAAEADNGYDDDCDPWIDEDFVLEGDLIITELVRNPRFGNPSLVYAGQWFEVYNTSDRAIDMSNWYMMRSVNGISDAFFVDPADEVVIPAGDYGVFCRTDDYESSVDAVYPLLCDYIWGAEGQSYTYSSTYHDNTFYLLRDHDRLAFFIEGGSLLGRMIDDVHWSWSATALDNWPRDASYSTSLDPDAFDGTFNDAYTSWCSTGFDVTTDAYTWWESGLIHEHGTPGAANYPCN
jgi:hypothetical protein